MVDAKKMSGMFIGRIKQAMIAPAIQRRGSADLSAPTPYRGSKTTRALVALAVFIDAHIWRENFHLIRSDVARAADLSLEANFMDAPEGEVLGEGEANAK